MRAQNTPLRALSPLLHARAPWWFSLEGVPPVGTSKTPQTDASRSKKGLPMSLYVVESMDEFQPEPRAGKFFGELVVQGEIERDSGIVILAKDKEDEEANALPKRVRVLQLGPARDGEPWDFEPDWEVIVPYHAGNHFKWINQSGVEESLWILDSQEVIALFRPR